MAKSDKLNTAAFREFAKIPEAVQDIRTFYFRSECRPIGGCYSFYRALVLQKQFRHAGREALSFRDWLLERDRARKDLWWLGHDCIGTPQSGSGFVESTHREMLAQFVPKNFDGVYHAGYTLDEARRAIGRQEREKEALILTPTGSYKSTANKIDCVQWMLNVPDIRILIMTGSGSLSDKFLKEVKGFFYRPEREAYTYFQLLFPEYILDGDAGLSSSPIFCPARLCRQEGQPTLWVNSIDGRLAGWHCDLFKGDDIVNEDNSNTPDTREKLKARYDNIVSNRPDEWAFKDHIGTRYDEDDWYGSRIEEWRLYPETNQLRYLCRSAWTLKPEYEDVSPRHVKEHMVANLYFPEKMPFSTLIGKARKNEKTFRCQQLNQPVGTDYRIQFDEDALRAHVINIDRVPPAPDGGNRPIMCMWDTAHGNKPSNDYSSGVAGYVHAPARALYALEVRRDKWRDSELAVQIVELHIKWNALFSEIEKFPGWELLAAEIQRNALFRYNRHIALIWREVDNTSGAKRNRVKGLEVMLSDDRLWFVDGEWIDDLVLQFKRFNGIATRRKDDIPDSIAFFQRLIPPAARGSAEEPQESEQERKDREAAEMRKQFFERQKQLEYSTYFPDYGSVPLVAAQEEPAPPPRRGPGRFFGNTRIHL